MISWLALLQGFSVDWWKSKHNTHHAAPNELDENHQVHAAPAFLPVCSFYIATTCA